MPGQVRAARWIMWAQTVLGTLEVLFFLAILFLSGMPGLGVLPWFFYLTVAPLVLVGPLSIGFGSRRRWVRFAGIGIEGVSILEHGYSMLAPLLGPNILTLVNVALTFLVIFMLSGATATDWFER